jgi:hypothetical protein
VDHIPTFLEEIIGQVSELAPIRAGEAGLEQSETARQHGEQRWQLGYDLASLVREYDVLQECILLTAKEAGIQVSIDEFKVLAQCSSTGVAEAATQYMRHRDGQLEAQRANLAFLAEAGQLLSSSLDYRSTLAHVAELAVPRLADGCAIYLQEDLATSLPIAHTIPWKAELIREIHRRFPPSMDRPSRYLAVLHR